MLGSIAQKQFDDLGVHPKFVCGTQTASMSAALARRRQPSPTGKVARRKA